MQQLTNIEWIIPQVNRNKRQRNWGLEIDLWRDINLQFIDL